MSTVTEALNVLKGYGVIAAAFVFGSRVEGTADEYSDIDLAVFVEGAEDWDIGKRARTSVLVQQEVGYDIELHFFPATALEESEPASFATYVKEHGVRVPVESAE